MYCNRFKGHLTFCILRDGVSVFQSRYGNPWHRFGCNRNEKHMNATGFPFRSHNRSMMLACYIKFIPIF